MRSDFEFSHRVHTDDDASNGAFVWIHKIAPNSSSLLNEAKDSSGWHVIIAKYTTPPESLPFTNRKFAVILYCKDIERLKPCNAPPELTFIERARPAKQQRFLS